jgi:CPA2 family monovalent cation:H+ antiporter-2
MVLIARGEFSIVIAALGAGLADGPELGALAAGYVLLTAMLGPILAKFSDRVPLPPRLMRRKPEPATAA